MNQIAKTNKMVTSSMVNKLHQNTVEITFSDQVLFSAGLPAPSISITDALNKCPIKNEFFIAKKSTQKERRFNNSLLNDLDNYLEELRPKKFDFVTDGIEAMNDISKLGFSDRQLKKFNRVSRHFNRETCEQFHVMRKVSKSDTCQSMQV